jgi:hypothetical protein
MKRIISALLILTLSLPTLAAAQEAAPKKDVTTSAATASPSPDGDTKKAVTSISPDDPGIIAPLRKDQKAPFPGILFSPRAAASVGADASTLKDKIKIEVDAAVRIAEAKKDFTYNELRIQCASDKSRLEATAEANEKRISLLESDLKKAIDATPSRPMWFGIGAGAGVVFTLATVFAVTRLTK